MTIDGAWAAVLDDAHRYPSPHNSQPIAIQLTGPRTARCYFDKRRGLSADDYGIPFGHVCQGVFLGHLEAAAAGHGYAVETALSARDMDFAAADHYHHFADLELHPRTAGPAELAGLDRLRARRTSRRPYDRSLVAAAVLDEAHRIAESYGHRFGISDDPQVVDKIITVNQETLFDDLQRDAVYHELMEWVRFSRRSADETGDGLSAETLLMPGPALKFAFQNRQLWQAPVIGAAIRGMYLRTMTGVTQVGWLEGPFAGPADYVRAGRCFIELWLALTGAGVYLHPYGTVITNPRSHARFAELAGAREEAGEMAWMLFRLGHSKQPPLSYRRPVAKMMISDPEVGEGVSQ